MLMRSLSVGIVGLALIFNAPLEAQDRAVAPTDVAVVADGSAAVVTWTRVPVDGVTYRVVRTLDVARKGIDITEPTEEPKVYDAKIEAGVTYFYQVIAVYRDATTAPAEFVSFTAPTVRSTTSEPLTVVTAIAPATIVMPTAITGVTVVGNTPASALVSWQAPAGAVSYSIKRSYGTTSSTPVSGLTTTSWTDHGPQGVGFTTAGTYTYDVTATMAAGPAISGQGGWKRPEPVCDEPPATLQPLTVLDPTNQLLVQSVNPAGPLFRWQSAWSRAGVPIALRIDRSTQGTGDWTLDASSCDGSFPPSVFDTFFDPVKGVKPNTTYLYKFTGFAASGDIGVGTVTWTSPNPSVMHWLSATSAGNNVALNFRYEPPATNPPSLTYATFHVTAPYGFDQSLSARSTDCSRLQGCSLTATGVPAGSHVFTVSAEWKVGTKVVYKISSPTTVVVP